MSLTENILRNADKVRYHMPGHSGNIPAELFRCDVTELDYSDNLLSPQNEIAELEKKIASVYHAEACLISTQGATTSLFEAIFATKDRGDFLLIGPLHKSIYNAMRVFGLKAWHIDTLTETTKIPSSVKAAIMTSPNYYGNCLPLEKICAFLRQKGIVSIVDASHGSHFIFHEKLPHSATEYADLVVHSIHKTLPVITGGSLLLLRDKTFVSACGLARKLLHTTSPCYIITCSVEHAFSISKEEYHDTFTKMFAAVEEFRDLLKLPFVVENTDDKTRLVVSSPFSGFAVTAALEKAGFVAEMSSENKSVFFVTPDNYRTLPKLAQAYNGLDTTSFPDYMADKIFFTPHDEAVELTFGGEWEEVPLEQAEGKKLYYEVGLYPPGVPLAYSHERLTKKMIELLRTHPDRRFGVEKGNVYVLKE